MPSYVFTEDYQVELMQQYHEAFDGFRGKFLVGEIIWTFADFSTAQSKFLQNFFFPFFLLTFWKIPYFSVIFMDFNNCRINLQ